MKPYQHILISLGYGAVLAASARHNLLDPGIYISALIGGELIDVIDHPLNFLVFARNENFVQEAWKRLRIEGFRAAVRYLEEEEDKRSFNRLRLHNVFSLTLIVLVAIFTSLFMRGTIYPFLMLGAFLLHMLTDIFGDFIVLGHYNNWLWVIPDTVLQWLGKIRKKLVWLALFWWMVVILGFSLVSFRVFWQCSQPSTYWGLVHEAVNIHPTAESTIMMGGSQTLATSGQLWLAYAPLLFLFMYFTVTFLLVMASAHKINLESPPDSRGKRVRFSTGSMGVLIDLFRGKLPKGQRALQMVTLSMQSDLAVWIIFLTVSIALVLTIGTAFHASLFFILIVPMIGALTFGTLIHTTIGEFGGVLGVLLATFLNLVLWEPGSSFRWPYLYGYYLFLTACTAWILGLIGGIFLRTNKRLSLVSFVIKVRRLGACTVDSWLYEVKNAAQCSLPIGYKRARQILFGDVNKKIDINCSQPDFLISSQHGMPTLSGEYYHLKVKDSIAPLLQNYAYVLCNNRLTSCAGDIGTFGLLPCLPRTRMIVDDVKDVDIYWNEGNYCWNKVGTNLVLPSCENATAWLKPGKVLGLTKTLGELFDDMLTKKTTFRTDLYLFNTSNDPCVITICGISCTSTSTKDYSTIETELYASEVYNCIVEKLDRIPETVVLEKHSARIVYPAFAFEDRMTVESMVKSAVFPMGGTPFYSKKSAECLIKALTLIPNMNKNTNILLDFKNRVILLAGQLGISFATLVEIITGKYNFVQFLNEIAHNLRGLFLR